MTFTSSPCIGFCRHDDASGLCIGCARTRGEIAAWRGAPAAVLEQIWADLPGRRAKLGIGLHRLDWTQEDVRSFISGTLRPGGGTWAIGVYGAVAEFSIGADETVEVHVGTRHAVAATTTRGALRFEVSDQVRALALGTTVGCTRAETIVLAVPRAGAGQPGPSGLKALGPDRDAIRTNDRHELLYDLGLGVGPVRFCVRTLDSGLARGLDDRPGQPWPDLLAGLGHRMLDASPTRVVLSPVGRIEVFTPIPLPGGQSPVGPHTHFLPAHLATRRETPPGIDLPEALVPCAIFYPETGSPEPCDHAH